MELDPHLCVALHSNHTDTRKEGRALAGRCASLVGLCVVSCVRCVCRICLCGMMSNERMAAKRAAPARHCLLREPNCPHTGGRSRDRSSQEPVQGSQHQRTAKFIERAARDLHLATILQRTHLRPKLFERNAVTVRVNVIGLAAISFEDNVIERICANIGDPRCPQRTANVQCNEKGSTPLSD
jgi:hypothetical protein